MQGVEGQIFGPMARTYGYALAGALVATFTVTPVLASFLLPEHVKEAETIVVRLLHRVYNPALRFALANRAIVVATGIAFLAVAGLLASRLGSEFLPHLEEDNFWIRCSMPMTLSLEDGEAAGQKNAPDSAEISGGHYRVLPAWPARRRQRRLAVLQCRAVRAAQAAGPMAQGHDQGETDRARFSAELQREMPGVVFNFSQYIQDNIEEAISGVKGVNSVKIVGPNLETLTKLAQQVRDEMSQVRGITDLGIFPVLGQPNLNINVDRAKAARYGLNSGDVNSVVQAAVGGAVATTVLEGDPAVRPGRPLPSRMP